MSVISHGIREGTERTNKKERKGRRLENVKYQVRTVGAHAVVMSHWVKD